MEDRYPSVLSDEERAARRAERAKSRREKLRLRRRRQMLRLLPVMVLGLALIGVLSAWSSRSGRQSAPPREKAAGVFFSVRELPEAQALPYSASQTQTTVHLDDTFPSEYAVLIDIDQKTILAEKGVDTIISPASMTKIMTLLVAAEQIEDLDATFTITREITDYCYVNDCSVVGLEVDETVSVRELLYGTILSSGADAALGLATFVSGSQDAFVELMNEKLEELGLSDTAHFTNCVGLYDKAHFCTVYDMAMILKAAMDNELCREVLGARVYETAPTSYHPSGQILSNWFLRKIEDHVPDGFEVIGAKTGYVVESGNCAASCGQSSNGAEYICVIGNAYNSWRAIFDHVALYSTYCVE